MHSQLGRLSSSPTAVVNECMHPTAVSDGFSLLSSNAVTSNKGTSKHVFHLHLYPQLFCSSSVTNLLPFAVVACVLVCARAPWTLKFFLLAGEHNISFCLGFLFGRDGDWGKEVCATWWRPCPRQCGRKGSRSEAGPRCLELSAVRRVVGEGQ